MTFTFLLWRCLREGRTTFHEKTCNKYIDLKPLGDECVLVFHTDCSDFRSQFGLTNQPVSDALYFAKREGVNPTLAFIEIKSEDVEHAVAQLKGAINAVKKGVGKLWKTSLATALIVLSTSPPTAGKEKQFQREMSGLGVTLKFKGGIRSGQRVDLRKYLP